MIVDGECKSVLEEDTILAYEQGNVRPSVF
jgi:hypothetical protein